MARRRVGGLVAAVLVPFVVAPACTTGSAKASASGKVAVVAAEDVWGSIAAQLGGEHAEVHSLITNPDTDPHDYEPTPRDARAMASARLVVTNGIGYDPWTEQLLAANPSKGRAVVNVGDLVGLKDGDNPHQWYSPTAVHAVVAAIATQYAALDPLHADYFAERRRAFEAGALADYSAAIATIKARYAGVPIGASESVVVPLVQDLGLALRTPDAFLTAVSEGAEPTARDKTTVDRQLKGREVKVFVLNAQNATPDVRRLVDEASAAGIPVVRVTETISPTGATFQAWQTAQLQALQAALATATGR